jgi:hypothetical protein
MDANYLKKGDPQWPSSLAKNAAPTLTPVANPKSARTAANPAAWSKLRHRPKKRSNRPSLVFFCGMN